MYTITESDDEIGLDVVINNKMIIGVIDKENNRTCIMQTYFYNQLLKRFEKGKYVVLPFITCKKICNENINDEADNNYGIESDKITDLISTDSALGGKGLKPVKAFNSWKEAYEWILSGEKEK